MSKPIVAGTPAANLDDLTQSASQRWALASLSLATLMSSLDASIANAALPFLARAFNASFQQVQWIVLAYLLALTSFIVGVGRLGDIVGSRRLLLAGIAVFTAASLVCGIAPTLPVLLAARGAQGIGAAGMTALAIALVGHIVPKTRTGRAMGLLGTMSAVGTALGPSLGGVLTARFGWTAIFLVNVPIGVFTLGVALRHLPVDRPTPKARSLSPLVDIGMFRDLTLAAGLAMSALVSAIMMTTLVVGPFYLSRALGLNAARTGFALSVGPLIAALAGMPAGRLVDRFGARRMTIAGLLGLAAGASIVSVASNSFTVSGYIAPIAVMTASYAVFQAANNTVLMSSTRPAHRGMTAGMLSLARNLGLITGASVMGTVFALASASSDVATAHPDAVAAGTRITFGIAAIGIVVALVVGAGSRALAQRRMTSRSTANAA